MAFDVQGAVAAGYSKSEIVDFLAQQKKFDTLGARNAGYTDDEIIQHLMVGVAPAGATSNPFMGAVGRAAELAGSGLEAIAEVGKRSARNIGEMLAPEGESAKQKKVREEAFQFELAKPLFDWAGSLKGYNKSIGYEPSTKLKDLADNPLNAVPFIAERVVTSAPDMAAAAISLPAYIGARTKEILDERMKNDNKTLDDATVGDVTAATTAAIIEGTLEKFATGRLFKGAPTAKTKPGRITKEAGIQAGTEGIEETAAYLGEAAGTVKGLSQQELIERAIEGAIVGGGLGATVQTGKEVLGRKAPEAKEAPPEAPTEAPVTTKPEAEAPPVMAPEEEALQALGLAPREEAPPPIPGVTETQRRMVEAAAEVAPEEAPEIPTETRPVEQPPLPVSEEIAALDKEAAERAAELKRAETRERGPTLLSVLRNQLSPKEVFDITPDDKYISKMFKMAPKRGQGREISDFVADGTLNPFIPENLIILKSDDASVISEKATAATEFIKERIRQGNFLTYDTNNRLETLGYSLQQVEEELARELTDEQLRAEANSIAAEISEKEGTRVAETAPEIVTARDITKRPGEERGPEEGVGFKQVVSTITPAQKGLPEKKVTKQKLYHGTSSDFADFDFDFNGGMTFFGDQKNIATKYAYGGGGQRQALSNDQKYVINGSTGVVYELSGNVWKPKGIADENAELITEKL